MYLQSKKNSFEDGNRLPRWIGLGWNLCDYFKTKINDKSFYYFIQKKLSFFDHFEVNYFSIFLQLKNIYLYVHEKT